MKTVYVIIIIILGLALLIFTTIHNNKEKKNFENHLDDNVKKPPVDD